MHKIPLLFSALILLIASSCGNKETQATASNQAEIITTDSATCVVNPLMGNWLNSSYHKAILDNLSPYKSLKLIGDFSEILVEENSVSLVYNNSESEKLTFTKESGEKFVLKLSNGLDLTYNGNNKAQIVGKKINESFAKVEKPGDGRSTVEQFVMSRLIAGTYNSKTSKVSFSENGSVSGIENYSFYKVYTVFEELSDFDIMEFRDAAGKASFKAWEIKNDELILFNIQPGTSYIFEKGDEWLRLKLIEAVG